MSSITLVTRDNQRIQTDSRIKTISKMLETLEIEEGQDTPVDITASDLNQILEFCMAHNWEAPEPAAKPLKSTDLKVIIPSEWAYTFLKDKSMEEISQFVDAVDYFDIPCLLSYCLARIAWDFKRLTFEEIQEKFGFKDEITLDEENALFVEYPWLHDKFV